MFILEMITILTVVGTICFVMEKFIMDNGRGRNDSK
jgi:flagellar biogenesis protein FliO